MAELLDDLARVHSLLTEAGIPRGGDRGFSSAAVRIGLLIDERNSLKDELVAVGYERAALRYELEGLRAQAKRAGLLR